MIDEAYKDIIEHQLAGKEALERVYQQGIDDLMSELNNDFEFRHLMYGVRQIAEHLVSKSHQPN